MSDSDRAAKWDRRRRAIVRNVLANNGFENISLPPSPYTMKGMGRIGKMKTVQSKVVWLATAETRFEGKRVGGINIFIYFRFDVQDDEITVQFRVPQIDDPDNCLSCEEKVRIQQHLDTIKDQKEVELIKALRVLGVWAPE